ncbi:MAG: hypothetical protein Q9202_005089 [Teloschistes flavicans]
MPLPDHELKLHGGCNCGAIRYRIEIPEISKRPTHPFPAETPIHLPLIATDHCNDCRKATGSVIPTWICVPASMLFVRFEPAPSHTTTGKGAQSSGNFFHPSMTALRQDSPESKGSTLRCYISSPQRTRTFCGNCGTNLTYSIFPMLEGYPDMFDVLLGTVDRESLQTEDLRPERHLWWSCGIDWVQELTSGGQRIPRHPKGRLNEFVDAE